MDILFLDANILFSAAYNSASKLNHLWRLPAVKLITSDYAIEEAARNLSQIHQLEQLNTIITSVKIKNPNTAISLPVDIHLRDKDKPILLAAITAKATHLITGDYKDFGAYFGKIISGISILPPAEYFKSRPT